MGYQKVLVTGAAGMLGGAVIRELSGRCSVRGFDLNMADHDIDWHVGDLTDAEAVERAVEGCDAVIHVGAIPNIWSGSGDRIIQVNVVGTWNVLSAAERAGIERVVLCSSDSVYGFTVAEGAMIPPAYLPMDDNHPLRPTDPYALSKKLCEEMGRAFADRGGPSVIALRPVFVAYPEMACEIAARAAAPESYKGPMAGGPSAAGGGPCWHYVDPRDVAHAFRLALELQDVRFDRFVIAADTTLAPEPTLERLRARIGRLPEIRDEALYRTNPHAPLYDLTRSREVLGFRARHDQRAASLAELD